jgi:superfamily I DNA/RNA helicase
MTTTKNLGLQKQKQIHLKTIKIFGPPGTGKTWTLIERVVKRYLKNGTDPDKIAFISFTNKAVDTAKIRALDAFPHLDSKSFGRFRTLHSYCRRYFEEEIFDPKDCMIDYALQNNFVKRSDNRLSQDNFTYSDWSIGIYDKARNLLEDPILVYKRESQKKDSLDVFIRKISTYEHYKTSGGERSFLDFTDMVERALHEVDFPSLDLLILDEAQDFTPLQWSLIYKMADKVKRIYLAGDDDQAIYQWNGADTRYFTKYFPGRKVVLRKTRRFGTAIHQFSQVVRKGIIDSVDKEFEPLVKDGTVKRYLSFKEIPFEKDDGKWFMLGRIHTTVNELKALAKDAGIYFSDNHGRKSFDQDQWLAIKAWTAISNGREIMKKEAESMYKYIREVSDPDYRTPKFWSKEPDYKRYNFQTLKEWCGLDLPDEAQKKQWWWILRRNFKPRQVIYFLRLLKRYKQFKLDEAPNVIIDTIHSVKGDEANHVLLYSKANWPSSFRHKDKEEKSNEKKVWYTGVTRARDSLHLLSTDYKYHYPIGEDYLVYVQGEK